MRWRTFAVGDAPGVAFADSSTAWQVEALAHWFAARMGYWGGASDLEQAA